MKKSIVWAMALLLALGLAAKTMVLPLKVDTQNHTSFQWLGKAISYYLLSGLQLNSFAVTDEEEIQFILNRNLVRFPFDITKATAMVLARENQADRLLWGKILYSSRSSSQISIMLFLIDVKGRVQKYLPLFKGSLKNIYQIQAELLKIAAAAIANERVEVRFPELNMPLPEYEKFIKSLLVVDADKKLDLLLPMAEKESHCDFLNFELAKIYLSKKDLAKSEFFLNRMSATLLFKDKKDFLLALINFLNGNADVALNQFIQLQRQNIYAGATNNNLGVIYLQKNNYQTAERCLRYALFLEKDPEIYVNLVCLQQAMGRSDQALEELNHALQLFPGDEKLLGLFANFLVVNENKELLDQAFRNYVLGSFLTAEPSKSEPLIKNPFQIRSLPAVASNGNSFYIEARNLFMENDFDGALEKVEEAMEVNPFLPENHHLLALIFLQKQQYAQAAMYGQSALFLKASLDNFLLQIKIFQAWPDKEKLKKTLALALQKFSQSTELLQMKSSIH